MPPDEQNILITLKYFSKEKTTSSEADGRTALGCAYLCYREHVVFVPGLERNSPRLAQNELLNDHIIWQLSGV